MTLERRSLGQQVYDRIKELILSGQLEGGQRIAEEALAAELGVSRTPVREALRRLDEYGLVRIEPRSYVEIAALSEDEAAGVVEVRAALEERAAERLAARATSDDVRELRAIAGRCRESLRQGDIAGAFACDSALHLEIAQRGGNRTLYETLERLDAKVQLVRLARCTTERAIAPMLRQHDAILDAIAAGDAAEARRLVRLHVEGRP